MALDDIWFLQTDDKPLKNTKKLNTSKKKKSQAPISDQMSSSKWVPIILVPGALLSFGQRLKQGALGTLPSVCHKIYDIR